MNFGLLLLFMLSGFGLGYFQPFPRKLFKIAERLTMGGLIILLITMGAKIGVDPRIIANLDKIGLQALLLALSTIAGSVVLVKIYSLRLQVEVSSIKLTAGIDREENSENQHQMTVIIVASVISGILAGLYIFPESVFPYLDNITTYALAVLLVGVGIDVGINRHIFHQIKLLGWRLLLLPLLIAVGSIAAGIMMGLLLGLSSKEAAAVAAGFGWYSLSGVLIAKLYSVELGSLAFLTNVFRELLTFLTLPFIVKYLGKLTSIAPGGATAMDVTLPLVKKTAGEELVIPCFISGVVLSVLVPILVPFFLNI